MLPHLQPLLQFQIEDDPESGVKMFLQQKYQRIVLVLGEVADVYYKVNYRGGVWAVPKHYLYIAQEATNYAS